jgi:hypothetical protein
MPKPLDLAAGAVAPTDGKVPWLEAFLSKTSETQATPTSRPNVSGSSISSLLLAR